jgi:hypothetical protein
MSRMVVGSSTNMDYDELLLISFDMRASRKFGLFGKLRLPLMYGDVFVYIRVRIGIEETILLIQQTRLHSPHGQEGL